jgi:hypothetical protein
LNRSRKVCLTELVEGGDVGAWVYFHVPYQLPDNALPSKKFPDIERSYGLEGDALLDFQVRLLAMLHTGVCRHKGAKGDRDLIKSSVKMRRHDLGLSFVTIDRGFVVEGVLRVSFGKN